MVLRQGLNYNKEAKWTAPNHDWLARQGLEPTASQQALAAEIKTETLLMAHVKRLYSTTAGLTTRSEQATVIDALMSFRGISVITCFAAAVKVGDWTSLTGATIGGS